MGCDVLDFGEIDQTQVALVGGKGAHLGELSRIEGIRVPVGFCVTTDAFRRIMASAGDRRSARSSSSRAGARRSRGDPHPERRDPRGPSRRPRSPRTWRQRSRARSPGSASTPPTPSGRARRRRTSDGVVRGPAGHVPERRRARRRSSSTSSRCWASLFSERAVTYRLRNGFDHGNVRMAVVVQHMVSAQAAGILFTADPITSNRKVVSVEAVLRPRRGAGLRPGERGRATRFATARSSPRRCRRRRPEAYAGARAGPALTIRRSSSSRTSAGGSRRTSAARRTSNGAWTPRASSSCRAGRSRRCSRSPWPTTTENHVYVSVGHQQMMTDAMKPLGLSLFQLTALAPMHEAGGRLFVDVTAAPCLAGEPRSGSWRSSGSPTR